jgi:ferredoxin-NADP reductase
MTDIAMVRMLEERDAEIARLRRLYDSATDQAVRYADEIARLTAEHESYVEWTQANLEPRAEIERLTAALASYACPGIGKCREKRLDDGTCIHELSGQCGDEARRALEPKP